MTQPKRRATYEDVVQVPDHMVAELIDGELFASPRPAARHARAGVVIVRTLEPFDREPGGLDAPGGWWILPEPELHLRDDVLVPDLAGWRRERMPRIPDVAAFTLAPDWVCEVTSPGTGRLDRCPKMGVYAREGVCHLWLVDPLARTLETYRLESARWVVLENAGGEDVVRAEPFDALELQLERWWLPPEPATPGR